MKKIIIPALFLILFGCMRTECPTRSCVTISCPDSDELIMSIPYSEEEWERIHKDGDSWTATFRCKGKEKEHEKSE